MGCGGLVGHEDVAGVREQDELGAWDTFGDQAAIGGGDETVIFSMDDQSGSGNFGEAAVGFPSQDGLQLGGVTQWVGIPLAEDGEILIDALARRSGIINKWNGSFGAFGALGRAGVFAAEQ